MENLPFSDDLLDESVLQAARTTHTPKGRNGKQLQQQQHKTNIPETNNSGNSETEKGGDEDKFEFDESYDETTEACLVSAMLAGLYYIPPERILRHQSGWGRRVRYKEYHQIHPNWTSVSPPSHLEAMFDWVESAEVPRVAFDGPGGVRTAGTFRIYRARLACSSIDRYVDQLEADGLIRQKADKSGISVSNAGGYHSKVANVVSAEEPLGAESAQSLLPPLLGAAVMDYLEFVECHDCKSAAVIAGRRIGDCLEGMRQVQGPGTSSEGWVNISTHGAYNRLHTHEGAAWSAVLYVKDISPEASASQYSGNLLLKPSPHASECTYKLNDIECERLNLKPLLGKIDGQNISNEEDDAVVRNAEDEICNYISLPAEKGVLFVMPSWLHHCVMPVAVKKQFRGGFEECSATDTHGGEIRISLAMNFNAAPPPPAGSSSGHNNHYSNNRS